MNAPAKIRVDDASLVAASGKYRLNVHDYLLLDEAGSFRGTETELVDGDVIVMGPEWMPHMRVKDDLAYMLRRNIEELGLDLMVGTGGSVQLSGNDQPRPDIIVFTPVSSDRAVPQAFIRLLVEISSTTLSFDLNEKTMIYARSAVPEYWTVDVAGREVYRWSSPDASGFAEHIIIPFGDPITSATINGLTIATDAL